MKYPIGGRAQDLTCVQQKFSSKLKQASRRLKRLACFGDDGDGSDDVYRIWVGVCKKDRHYRHARILLGVWGTPQKCVCGYPNAMLAKHVYPQNVDNQTRCPYKFVYAPE